MDANLDHTFAALADPTRRAMLAQLAQGEANVSDLAKPFLGGMTLPAITKHVKVLEKAGLITKGRDAQFRPCRLNAEPLKEASDWIEQHRIFFEESLDRLEVYLDSITTKKPPKGNAYARKRHSKKPSKRD